MNDHKERNARITTIALGFVGLFLFACSTIFLGLGTLGPTFLKGLGMFPYLGGAVLSFIALSLICGALLCAVTSSVHSCQKERNPIPTE